MARVTKTSGSHRIDPPTPAPKPINEQISAINQRLAEVIGDLGLLHRMLTAALMTAREQDDLIPAYIKVFRVSRDVKDDIEEAMKPINAVVEELRSKKLPEAFDMAESRTHTMENGDRVTINQRVTARIKASMRDAAFARLRKNKKKEIIVETVNASTLSALAGSLLEENKSLPSEIFEVDVLPQASLTRGKGTKK